MKVPLFIFLLVMLCPSSFLHAQENLKFTVSSYYQQDDFQWSIAGDIQGNSPNIMSELTWKNLRGPAVNTSLETFVWKKLFLKGLASWSSIQAGKVNDTDYLEDDRHIVSFSADLESNKGNSTQYMAAIGYKVDFKNFVLKPYLGYSLNSQKMFLLDDFDLNSHYKTNWNGIVTGVTLQASVQKLEIEIDGLYHQVNYKAAADWNMISNYAHPISFQHTANGYGLEGSTRLAYAIRELLHPFIFFKAAYWRTGAGIDELFYQDGSNAFTHLNKAERRIFSLGLGINVYF